MTERLTKTKPLVFVLVVIILFLQACATSQPRSENPWSSPNRGFSVSSDEESKMAGYLKPCMDYAKKSFSEAKHRFKKGLPPDAFFGVVALNDNDRNFYLEVQAIEANMVKGTILSNERINGRTHRIGSSYRLNEDDILDWIIIYSDRPEEGNLIGKYFLLRQDGLVSGVCDPKAIESQGFRLYRADYSFVPPGKGQWDLRGRDANADVSMQQEGSGPNGLDTVYALRYMIPQVASDHDLVKTLNETEKKNLGPPARYSLQKHDVVGYRGKATTCAKSHQVIEDRQALLSSSGERGPMIREILSLVCVHPKKRSTAVQLTYAHRYKPGHRDDSFSAKAEGVFKSLAFTTNNLPSR